jgi:hypothetical protein
MAAEDYSIDQVKMILDAVGLDDQLKQVIESFARAEFRRGYLLGQRDMKHRVENAVAALGMDPA